MDAYDLARAEVMVEGYTALWGEELYEPIAVEQEFDLPEGTAGKLDVLVYRVEPGTVRRDVYVVEHKSATSDAGYYWRRLALDHQVSTYIEGAKALAPRYGYDPRDVRGVIWDLLVKPTQKPLLATPEESRKYTKKGFLYKTQRIEDERPDQYKERLKQAILANPEQAFGRQSIVRTPAELEQAANERRMLRYQMRVHEHTGLRNPDACARYGRLCGYWGVCAGEADLSDDTLFRTSERTHEELSPRKLRVVTNSEFTCWRRCQREHLYRYQVLRRPIEAAHALRFGTLIHLGLEAWWNARMHTRDLRLLRDAAVQRMHEEANRVERGEPACVAE